MTAPILFEAPEQVKWLQERKFHKRVRMQVFTSYRMLATPKGGRKNLARLGGALVIFAHDQPSVRRSIAPQQLKGQRSVNLTSLSASMT